MREQPLRLVPPRCVAFVFFGASELVRCRASFLQIVSHARTLSILERASYKRQRSKETGKPFLLLSVYTAADIAKIVKQGTVPFVQRCDEALQHRACRVATPTTKELPYMRYSHNDQRNQPLQQANEQRHASLTVSVNKFACLSTDDDQPPHMQPTEQQHQVSSGVVRLSPPPQPARLLNQPACIPAGLRSGLHWMKRSGDDPVGCWC